MSTNVIVTATAGTTVAVDAATGAVAVDVTPAPSVEVDVVVGSAGPASGINQLTGDVTAGPGGGSQVATISNNAVTNAKMADMAQSTIKGRAVGAGTGDPTDLTATQATAILNQMVGDTGAGVTKGLVPAAVTGGASTNFLRKDGTWAIPPGTATGDMTKAVYDPQNTGFISGDVNTGTGGTLKMDGGTASTTNAGNVHTYGGGTAGGHGGNIYTFGTTAPGGDVTTNGGSTTTSDGGSVITNGGTNTNTQGGTVNTSGGSSASANGGNVNTSGNTSPGGSITTANGGGSINTAGVGSIGMGVSATRTTVVGTAVAARSQSMPDSAGMYLVTTGGGSYLSGLVVTSDTSDATNDIDISTGIASDSANALILNLSSALIKQQDAVWAVGTNAGGQYQSAALAGTISTSGSSVTVTGVSTAFLTDFVVGDVITDTTGAQSRRIATITNNTSLTVESVWTVASSSGYKRGGKAGNTAYYIYLIRRSDTGVVDVFFTTRNPSQTVTLPTSYDSSRLIGGYHNNGTPAVDGVFSTDGFTACGYTPIAYSTTLATNVDTGLFFYAAANEIWMVDVQASSTGAPSGGAKAQITAPTSATTEAQVFTFNAGGTAGQDARITAINTLTAQVIAGASCNLTIRGLLANSSTTGAVAIGIASVTGGQTTTIAAKSYFTARRR